MEALSECSDNVIAKAIRDEVDKRILQVFCDRLAQKVAEFNAKLASLNPTIQLFLTIVSTLDGLVTDLEQFEILGFGLPNTVLFPLRRVVDNLISIVDTINDAVFDVFQASADLLADCEEKEIVDGS